MSQIVTKSKQGKTILLGYDHALGFFFDRYDDLELFPTLELSTYATGLNKAQFLRLIDESLGVDEKLRLAKEISQVLVEGNLAHYFIPKRIAQYDDINILQPPPRITTATLSPSFHTLQKLIENGIQLDSMKWREFEELVADLLEKDGYIVELGPGQKDGGKDLVAIKDMGGNGLIKSVWQAKLNKPNNKVGLETIRELADTRNEHKASKGVIVTSTYLTSGALARIEKDKYILGKVDKDDLLKWIDRVLRERRK